MAYVLVIRLICLMFLFILTVHPSCQRIFDFYEHAVVKKSSFI